MDSLNYTLSLLLFKERLRDGEQRREQYDWLDDSGEPSTSQRRSLLLRLLRLRFTIRKPQLQGARDARRAQAL